jgi:hypothetical protein
MSKRMGKRKHIIEIKKVWEDTKNFQQPDKISPLE